MSTFFYPAIKEGKSAPLFGTTFEVVPEPWRLSDSRKLRMTLRNFGKSLAVARWAAVRVPLTALQLLTAWDTKENCGFLQKPEFATDSHKTNLSF